MTENDSLCIEWKSRKFIKIRSKNASAQKELLF